MASLYLIRGRRSAAATGIGASGYVIDASALAEIWDQHADRLLLIARSIGGPAEDAVQEAFVALARQSELPRDPLAWLVRVARNQLIQWHRGNQRRRAREVRVCETAWFDCEILSVERTLDGREVTAALIALPSPDREIIVMHLWGEMTFDSIADVIGITRATAHRAFVRGLQTLRLKFNSESNTGSMRLYNERR